VLFLVLRNSRLAMAKEEQATARYLLPDLPEDVTEDVLLDYFSALGELEEVGIKEIADGSRRTGSVKFLAPTMELRGIMLDQQHEIGGHLLSVQTWKMQKLQKPGYAAKLAAERAAKKGTAQPGLAPSSARAPIVARPARPIAGKGWTGSFGPAASASSSRASPYGKGGGDWNSWNSWGDGGMQGDSEAAFWKGVAYAKGAAYAKGGLGMSPAAIAPSSRGKGPGSGAGAVAAAKGGGKAGKEEQVTARFLLGDLPDTVTEEAISEYFSMFGAVEDVSLKIVGADSHLTGSVKFENPTMELRKVMLKDQHEIDGQQISVCTWKMKKQARPGNKGS
jgi:hypothetical protein